VKTNDKTECWSDGVLEHGTAPLPHRSITPLLQRSGFPLLRLARRLLIGAALLAVTMTGCGPSSDKAGKQSGTNAAVPQVLARTNRASALRPGVVTNPVPASSQAAAAAAPTDGKVKAAQAAARSLAKTNGPAITARTGVGTNAVSAAGAKSGIAEKVRSLQTNPTFYPAVGVVFVCLCLAVVLVVRLLKSKAAKSGQTAQPGTVAKVAAKRAKKKEGIAAIHS
jgi:hypothetical protein